MPPLFPVVRNAEPIPNCWRTTVPEEKSRMSPFPFPTYNAGGHDEKNSSQRRLRTNSPDEERRDWFLPRCSRVSSYIAVCCCLFILSCGVAMSADGLIDEVFSLNKPERFKPIPVDSIVQKYVPIGLERNVAIEKLKAEGLWVQEEKLKLEECPECDEVAVRAGYTRKRLLFFLPYDYGIAVQVGFKQGRVASVRGRYVKNAY